MSAAQEIDMLAFDHSELSFVTNTVTLRSSGVNGNYPGSVDNNMGLHIGIGEDCEPTSASCIRRSSEGSTMDCDHSKLNGTMFGIHDWLNYLRDQAAMCRKLVEQADDPLVKTEILALASVCDEIADNIEDHLTGGEDHAPRGPLSRLS
jgi:hypothetical protein